MLSGLFFIHSFSILLDFTKFFEIYRVLFLVSVNMGPSSGVATREAKERDIEMARGPLQESSLIENG